MMVGFVALTLAACGGKGGTTTKYIELTYADWATLNSINACLTSSWKNIQIFV